MYESMFGNTQAIAQAVAEGLSARMRVDVVEVGAAPEAIDDEVDLLVVGGPTHAFGMSRPRTRQDAARQTEDGLVSTGIGLREWLAALRQGSARAAATFDTRINKPRLPGSAARRAEKLLRGLGFRIVARPASFYLAESLGPLIGGEGERAGSWGKEIGAKLVATQRRRRVS